MKGGDLYDGNTISSLSNFGSPLTNNVPESTLDIACILREGGKQATLVMGKKIFKFPNQFLWVLHYVFQEDN